MNSRFYSLFVVLLLGFSACTKDVVTGKSTLNYYSLDGEPKLGAEVLQSQIQALRKESRGKEEKVDSKKNHEELLRIRRIMKDLAKVSHVPKFPYEAHLADVPVVNAWCAPGGKIMVYEGLWDKEKGLVEKGNEDQLAAVLGHEMAHATARHVTESISRNMTVLVAANVAYSAIAQGSAEGADLFGQVFSEGFNIFVPSYSRKNEAEADKIGLFYMARAGYDPKAAVALWEKAAKKQKQPHSVYDSHPSSGERAATLKKYLPEALEIYQKTKMSKEKS